MSNKDLYKDEFGVYREVDEEIEDSVDGLEDDEHDHYEEDEADDSFDSIDAEVDDSYDEDEEYLNERRADSDIDED